MTLVMTLLPALLPALLAGPAFAQGNPALAELDRAGRAMAAARCARPVESKASRVGGSQDEMQSIDCRSFRVAIYVAHDAGNGSGPRESPMALVVLGHAAGLPAGLAVGVAPTAVQALLGVPSRQRGDSFSYLLDPSRPAGDSITFEVEADRVRAISWSWAAE